MGDGGDCCAHYNNGNSCNVCASDMVQVLCVDGHQCAGLEECKMRKCAADNCAQLRCIVHGDGKGRCEYDKCYFRGMPKCASCNISYCNTHAHRYLQACNHCSAMSGFARA